MITGGEFLFAVIAGFGLMAIIGCACSRPDDEPATDLDDKKGTWKGENEL